MNHLQQEAFEKLKEQFKDSPLSRKLRMETDSPFLEIPTDFPRLAITSFQANHVFFSLSASCSNSLKQLSSKQGVTLFTTLLAAYSTLLFRYTRQEHITIGCPAPENGSPGIGELTEAQLATKLFRMDLSGNFGFNKLLKRIHHEVLAANGKTTLLYDSLDEIDNSEFDAGRNSLCNIIFSYRNEELGNDEINEQHLNINQPQNSGDNADLALYVKDTAQGLKGVWTYNSALFEAGTVKRIANHFEVLLEAIVVDSEQTISQIQFLTETERHQLTSGWNTSKINYPADKCIHELFEEQAKLNPEATALIFEKKNLTYAELNERANKLGHYLSSKGVKPETLVPICTSRSLEMIIGIIGILKAGGVYVPIDPNYPLERVNYLLEDIGASVVVCNKDSRMLLKAFENIELVELNDEAPFFQNQPATNLNTDLSSNNLAYIIYTSGSTGRPKGVMIEHRALVDHCFGVIESAGLKTCRSFALFSPLVFDAGHSIIHSSFVLGACLHVLSDEVIVNSEKMSKYFEQNSIDCIKVVPSLWLSHANLQTVIVPEKVIIFGGEAFPLSTLNYLKKVKYAGNVFNHYGPTEVTIGKCIYKIDLNKPYVTVPIGKPFSNTRLYILDDHLQLTPPGVSGELYISGDGLARGYLNKPVLNAEKFIQNPFCSDFSFRKMYQTGDKVKWLANGNIEYLGRSDEQVKIQGHRIELGEIEDALLQSEMVCQAVVLANEDKRGNKQLVAYIVPAKPLEKETIIVFLREKLPEYMIPVVFVELEKIPLTGNGKINKKELEALAETNKKYVPPSNNIEADLAVIWQNLLNIEKAGIYDNFFELGGDSINAVVLFEKIYKKFHKKFPLAFIFNAPTIYQLAISIKASKKPELLSSNLIPIQPNGSKTPLFCMHAGLGDILFYGNLSLHLGDDQPLYGLQAKGVNGTEYPSSQMEEMANFYISEIRKVQPDGPYYLAGYCLGAMIAFEMAQQLTNEGQKVALLASFNGISPTYRNRAKTNNINGETKKKPKKGFAKVKDHLNQIAEMSLGQLISYGSVKFNNRIRNTYRNLYYFSRAKTTSGIFKLCFLFNIKVPGTTARFHVGQSLLKLQTKYKPKLYSGPMVVFRSPDIYSDPYLGWRSFVNGDIKTFDVPGVHKRRRDILNEPHVQLLAEEFKNFLDN
ncbi:MAG TPA: amino acid adenylation domain-containing protein [Mucilaginibacter sp.]|jgi:amino acid adenylation domain-containing protein